MVKPRQREYPTLKSSLNIVRETSLIAISCIFWIYCVVVLLVYIGTIFDIQDESIITIRVALNIENTEIFKIFKIMGIFSIIIFVFFTICLLIQRWQKGRHQRETK
ncbi:intracellular adhesion protein IcaD [Staphylococcus simiae]|nr:intracellular adhesion protein IcaD [Staphylococcus simiae]PNZ14954.1 intracellular adhesion protein D [Staphylococcus simiae]SNV84556.1 Polysaccharide intercellular adhesin (PIA) biosynthesis protein IcaD [Staphylococcus simiae]